MKIYALVLIMFLLSTPVLRAQVIYERTYTFASNSIEFPVELSDTSTFSFDNENDCNGIIVRHIDQYGNELTDNWFGAEGFSSGYHWIGHDSVLIWVEHGAFDVGPDSFKVYLWTPEQTEQLLSSGISFDFPSNRKFGAFLYSPERLVYQKGDTLFSYNLLTSTIEETLLLEGIYSINEFEKDILVISDDDDPLVLNDHLEEITEWDPNWTLPFSIGDALVLDSFLVGTDPLQPLSIKAVNVYDESLQDIDLSAILDIVEEIQVNQYWLFVKGKSNGEEMVVQINGNLEVVDVKTLEIPAVDKEFSYSYYPERVYAWSTDGIAGYKANYRICYPYSEPSPIKYLDIELDTMWMDSVYRYAHQYYIFYLSGVVKNLSQEVIKTYSLHHEEIPFFCGDGIYGGSLNDVMAEPNGVDTFSIQVWTYQVGTSFNRRFFVHHANHHLDSITANNDFLVNHLISSDEQIAGKEVIVFPNPFSDAIYIRDLPETTRLSLFNQTGQLVASDIGQLDNLGFLAPGIYFLQMTDGQSLHTTRVIKAE